MDTFTLKCWEHGRGNSPYHHPLAPLCSSLFFFLFLLLVNSSLLWNAPRQCIKLSHQQNQNSYYQMTTSLITSYGTLHFKKNTLYLNLQNVGDMSPTGDGTTVLCSHSGHVKSSPLAVQRQYLHFSVILRSWLLAQSPDWWPRDLSLCSQVLYRLSYSHRG